MAFRVLIVGAPGFYAYPRLRDALDLALANRLPDVQLITCGGPGVPALAASYAHSRGIPLSVVLADYDRYPSDAIEKRNALLITDTNAVVVVGDDIDLVTFEMVRKVKAKGGRVLIVQRKPGSETLEMGRRGLSD